MRGRRRRKKPSTSVCHTESAYRWSASLPWHPTAISHAACSYDSALNSTPMLTLWLLSTSSDYIGPNSMGALQRNEQASPVSQSSTNLSSAMQSKTTIYKRNKVNKLQKINELKERRKMHMHWPSCCSGWDWWSRRGRWRWRRREDWLKEEGGDSTMT